MISRKLTIPKTARYFLSAEPTAKVNEVVFVCHGYAQLANEFLEGFASVQSEHRLIVAPWGSPVTAGAR